MIEERLREVVRQALAAAVVDLGAEAPPDEIELRRPPRKDMGDFSTNVAFVWASQLGRPPREVAQLVMKNLPPADFISSAELAGPGFINFHVLHLWLYDVLREIAALGERFGRAEPTGERVQVEFVSANPTGPLHVGHARNAALGDALADVLRAAGHQVEREYYYNDGGRQMDLFAASVEARFLEQLGREAEFPEEGYRGEYIAELAARIRQEHGDGLADLEPQERRTRFLELAVRTMMQEIEATLAKFNIRFDTWFSEQTLVDTGAIDQAIERMREAGYVYDQDGAIWFRATDFGDDKDRVLIRSNGEPTYFAKDCAYLVHKFQRGFDHLVYVWGADHHGDVKRVAGAAQALGYDAGRMDFVVYQFVTFLQGGQPVRMSKRTGSIITLDELIDEVGVDAARYTLVSRSNDSPMEFDIEEVKRQSLDNPVYYVQYAHARIASILRHAREQGIEPKPIEATELELLTHEAELELLRKLSELPEEIVVAANLRGPYRLTRYVEEVAAEFHRFYTECRVVTEDAALTQARLWVCVAAKRVIGNVLGILGVSAPERMERTEQ